MNFDQWSLIALVGGFTLVGAVCDARTKKLPNRLTVPAFALGLVFHAVIGAMNAGAAGLAAGLGFAFAGFATGFSILLVLWLIGGGGAGDVKMMGALGAWLGPKLTLYVFIFSAVFVAFASVGVLAIAGMTKGMAYTRRRYLKPANTDRSKRPTEPARRRLMPYGVPLALATWFVLAVGVWRGWI